MLALKEPNLPIRVNLVGIFLFVWSTFISCIGFTFSEKVRFSDPEAVTYLIDTTAAMTFYQDPVFC